MVSRGGAFYHGCNHEVLASRRIYEDRQGDQNRILGFCTFRPAKLSVVNP
jgi:hypothetical protein